MVLFAISAKIQSVLERVFMIIFVAVVALVVVAAVLVLR